MIWSKYCDTGVRPSENLKKFRLQTYCKELLTELKNLKLFSPRKAAGKWHPDKHQGVDEKKRAERIFMHIASGYEVFLFAASF